MFGPSSTPTFQVIDGNYGYQHTFLPCATTGALNSIVQAGDQAIIGQGNLVDVGRLTLSVWSNTKSGIRITSTNTTIERPSLNFSDGSQMDSAEQLQREPSDADVLSLESGYNVRAVTYDIAGAVNINTIALTANNAYFHPIYLSAGTICTCALIFKSATTATNCYVALYNKGYNANRLAVSASTAVPTGRAMLPVPFSGPVTITTSGSCSTPALRMATTLARSSMRSMSRPLQHRCAVTRESQL